jgi:chromosome segregation protein
VKLKRLEILGFKSFADPIELVFPDGITAIIGPNGCGKSNVADALRWVLGNSNPKQLRVDRMDDVIFSGSSGRKPLGMAEVKVTFDNEDRTLPVEFSEVAVARRFFRSGDGEYILNGSRCRLMDVTDLIADVGLASNGYWILEADMVKTLLSPKPEDRRFLFDEAAGIIRYKIQRHRAELKLSAAAADLERLEDVLSEVRRNADALKKQAALLSRYEKAAGTVAAIQALLAFRERTLVAAELSGLRQDLARTSSEEQDLIAELSAVGARHSASKLELERAQTALDEAHARCSALDKERGDGERDLAVAVEKKRSLVDQKADLAGRAAEARSRAALQASVAEESRKLLDDLGKQQETGRASLTETGAAAAEAAKRLEAARARAEEGRQSLSSARSGLEALRASIAKAREDRITAGNRLAEANARFSLLKEQSVKLEDDLQGARTRHAETGKASVEARSALDSASAASLAAEAVFSEKTSSWARADAVHSSTASRVSELEAVAGTPGKGTLASLLKPVAGHARAVGAFLDAFQDARVCDPGNVEGGKGERVVLPVEAPDAELPKGAKLLSSVVKSVPASLSGLLSSCILAPDRQTALRWMLAGSRLPIVTPEGDLMRPEGLVRLGVPEGGSGALERQALLEEAREILEEAALSLGAAAAAQAGAAKALEASRSSEQEARTALDSALQKQAAAGAEVEAASAALDACRSSLAATGKSIPSLEAELQALASDRLDADLNAAEGAERELMALAEASSAQASAALEEHGMRLREESEALNAQRLLEGRIEAAASSGRQAASSEKSAMEEAGILDRRSGEVAAEIEALSGRIGEVRARMEKLRDLLEEAHGRRSAATSSRAARLEESTALDSRVARLREDLADLREKRAGLSSAAAVAEEKLRQPFDESALPPDGSRLAKMEDDQLRNELRRVTAEREGLGPVNMLATQEYSEAVQRLEFLETQRQDLVKARQSLLQAISEINSTAAERFRETFESVRQNFRELFSRLFEGGEADIQFIESEDPLEGGVAITARPRGKKMETLSALSGGEKAMTAVALLFALYLVKPSPFCVLDELDAPLDDANVDRFIELLKSFSSSTQFVVITHNRRTMEAADRLFGVTMAEEGVSSQASVSMEAVSAEV